METLPACFPTLDKQSFCFLRPSKVFLIWQSLPYPGIRLPFEFVVVGFAFAWGAVLNLHHESRKTITPLPLQPMMPYIEDDAEYFSPRTQAYDADMESPNDLLVDPDDYVTEQPESEKDEVAIINPEQLDNDVDMSDRPRADDCKSPSFPGDMWPAR